MCIIVKSKTEKNIILNIINNGSIRNTQVLKYSAITSDIVVTRKYKNKIKYSSKTIKNVPFTKGCDLSTEI